MAWVKTRNIQKLFDDFNREFPNRDRASDGSVGDLTHQGGKSGHNPDKTGNAEYKDGDALDEVRAADIDDDLRGHATMEQVVQYWIKLLRAGVYLPFRYIIYKRRIWRKTNGWKTETYTGPSPHEEHVHTSGDYTQTADNWTGSYRLDEVNMPTVEEIADELMKRLNLKPDGKTAAGRTLGGSIDALCNTDGAVNPILQAKVPDFNQPADKRREMPLATWVGYTDKNRNTDNQKILDGVRAMLAAIPGADPQQLANLIADRLASVLQNEDQAAIKTACSEAVRDVLLRGVQQTA